MQDSTEGPFQEPQPVQRRRVPWGFRELMIVTAIVIMLLFLLSAIIIFPLEDRYGEESAEALTGAGVANTLWYGCIIATVLWFVLRRGGTARDLGLRPPLSTAGNRWLRLAGIVIAAYFISLVSVNLYGVLVDLAGLDFLEPAEQIPDDFYEYDVALAVLGVAVVIGAPMGEEVFFRGFLFGGLRDRLPLVIALLISGVLFSMAHFNPGLVIPFTIIGITLAWAYQRSGTLLAPMATHFLFNFGSFMILAFFPEAR
jgi:uncharacterized protein